MDEKQTETPAVGGTGRPKGKPFFLGKLRIEHWQLIAVMLAVYDYCAVVGSYFAAIWFRFEHLSGETVTKYLNAFRGFVPLFGLVCILIFWLFRMYNSIWRYASMTEFTRTFFGSLTASVVHSVAITIIFIRMPMSYYLMGAVLQFALLFALLFWLCPYAPHWPMPPLTPLWKPASSPCPPALTSRPLSTPTTTTTSSASSLKS